jgi:rubrerythrin
MSIDLLLNGYVVLLMIALGAVMLYSAHRQKLFRPTPSADRIFRCRKCGFVYTDDADVDRSRCQQCGTLNEAIRF